MKSKQLFLAAVCAGLAINVLAAPTLPATWSPARATFTVADGVISIKTNDKARTAGINGTFRNLEPLRYKVSFQVKGQGKVQAALNSGGIAYSKTVKLTEQWQSIEMTYFPKGKNMILMIVLKHTVSEELTARQLMLSGQPKKQRIFL